MKSRMCLFVFLFFYVGLGLREVSQRRALNILLQMACERARDDFSRPRSGTGTITHVFFNRRYVHILMPPQYFDATRVGGCYNGSMMLV